MHSPVNNGDGNAAELCSALHEARSCNEQLNEQSMLFEKLSQQLELVKITNDEFQLTELQVNTMNHLKELESALNTESSNSWMQKC